MDGAYDLAPYPDEARVCEIECCRLRALTSTVYEIDLSLGDHEIGRLFVQVRHGLASSEVASSVCADLQRGF